MNGQRRIASIFLSQWPIDHFFRGLDRARADDRRERPARDAALALVMPGQGGLRIVAATHAACAEGVEPGQGVADALALYPTLDVHEADPAADRAALRKLSDWCGRYTPWTAPDPCGLESEPDGILMDITGCAHLFGGEAALAEDLIRRLRGFNIHARVAMASTPGAAWALARFGGKRLSVLPTGEEKEALAALPVAALRVGSAAVDGLARLGLKQVGDLYGRARAPLTARFGRAVSQRLDEALGYAMEPISPQMPLVPYRARLHFADGLTRLEDIETAIEKLASELCNLLARDRKGARRLELLMFRADGDVTFLQAGTSMASHEARHLARLFREKLQQVDDELDMGFGIETMSLAALAVDPLRHRQEAMTGERARESDIDALMDRLSNRLGAQRVTRLVPRESHVPERAVRPVAVLCNRKPASADEWRRQALQHCNDAITRPLSMLAAPEPIEVMAEIPEGPPRHFRWRKALYQVARAEGPERIAPEWWRDERARTRDYYRVEDTQGRRFWLFRDGLYTRDEATPRWFIQGMFG